MVSLTLAVFSGMTPLPGAFSVLNQDTQPTSLLLTSQIHYETSSQHGLLLTDEDNLSEGLTLEEDSKNFEEPTPALKGDLPEDTIVAMLKEPTPTNTPTPTASQPTVTPEPKKEIVPTESATPTPTETPTSTPPPAVSAPVDLESLFQRFADEYGVDKEQMKRIAQCESGFNNEASNGNYVGMFQYATSSWSSQRIRMGADPNPDLRRNPEEAIRTAAYHIANSGTSAWPNCK